MQLFCPSAFLAGVALLNAGLASAHNGIVRILNQNQTAFVHPPDQPQYITPVFISPKAPWNIWNQWNATHKEGTDDWSFRNAGSNQYALAQDGVIVTAAASEEVFWTLTSLPGGGHLIKSTLNGLVWTNVAQYNGQDAELVLREADGSPGQRFNFLTLTGRLE